MTSIITPSAEEVEGVHPGAKPSPTPQEARSPDAPPSRPWLNEPSEKAWVDESTGYRCLAYRGPTGAWCGYVAIPESHPAHGLDYYSSGFDIEDLLSERKTLSMARVQHAINEISVHGGLTFARDCSPAQSQSDGGWWFGFDCAHAGDFCPNFEDPDHPVLGLGRPTGWGSVITYRTLEFVEAEISSLAAQLARIAADFDRQDREEAQRRAALQHEGDQRG